MNRYFYRGLPFFLSFFISLFSMESFQALAPSNDCFYSLDDNTKSFRAELLLSLPKNKSISIKYNEYLKKRPAYPKELLRSEEINKDNRFEKIKSIFLKFKKIFFQCLFFLIDFCLASFIPTQIYLIYKALKDFSYVDKQSVIIRLHLYSTFVVASLWGIGFFLASFFLAKGVLCYLFLILAVIEIVIVFIGAFFLNFLLKKIHESSCHDNKFSEKAKEVSNLFFMIKIFIVFQLISIAIMYIFSYLIGINLFKKIMYGYTSLCIFIFINIVIRSSTPLISQDNSKERYKDIFYFIIIIVYFILLNIMVFFLNEPIIFYIFLSFTILEFVFVLGGIFYWAFFLRESKKLHAFGSKKEIEKIPNIRFLLILGVLFIIISFYMQFFSSLPFFSVALVFFNGIFLLSFFTIALFLLIKHTQILKSHDALEVLEWKKGLLFISSVVKKSLDENIFMFNFFEKKASQERYFLRTIVSIVLAVFFGIFFVLSIFNVNFLNIFFVIRESLFVAFVFLFLSLCFFLSGIVSWMDQKKIKKDPCFLFDKKVWEDVNHLSILLKEDFHNFVTEFSYFTEKQKEKILKNFVQYSNDAKYKSFIAIKKKLTLFFHKNKNISICNYALFIPSYFKNCIEYFREAAEKSLDKDSEKEAPNKKDKSFDALEKEFKQEQWLWSQKDKLKSHINESIKSKLFLMSG